MFLIADLAVRVHHHRKRASPVFAEASVDKPALLERRPRCIIDSPLIFNYKLSPSIMLVLRLKRIGKKHQAAFRLVVGERRSKLKGDYTEDLGSYNPHTKKVDFKAERVKYWLSVGAQASDTVHNLLVRNKVIDGKTRANHEVKKVKTDK